MPLAESVEVGEGVRKWVRIRQHLADKPQITRSHMLTAGSYCRKGH